HSVISTCVLCALSCSLSLFSFCLLYSLFTLFFLNATAPTHIYTLSLHDALPISRRFGSLDTRPRTLGRGGALTVSGVRSGPVGRSEEHTSELQSRFDLVCRLLLEKKKNNKKRKSENQEKERSGTAVGCDKRGREE